MDRHRRRRLFSDDDGGSRYSMETGITCNNAVESSGTDEQDHVVAVASDASVLITAEQRDERSDCARSIHIGGPRRIGRFVEFDCASPSVLRVDGQRTIGIGDGASDLRYGFREALGGTLFMDRIEVMSDGMQRCLMSLLDEHLTTSVAVSHSLGAPRIITGASGSLLPAISAGTFNDTLFYRLNVIHLDFTNGYLRGARMKVRDLMSTPPQTCRPDADLGAIANVMWDHDCGFVPLIDGFGKLVGVITDRDICIATATRHRPPENISAAETTTGTVHACGPDDSVSDALATMKEFKVRRLPVVDGTGQLQGIISMNDIVRASDQKRKPPPGEVVSAMAVICARRTTETIAASGV